MSKPPGRAVFFGVNRMVAASSIVDSKKKQAKEPETPSG